MAALLAAAGIVFASKYDKFCCLLKAGTEQPPAYLPGAGNGNNTSTGQNPPNSAEDAPPGSIHNLPLPQAVAAVKSYVAKQEKVEEGKVLVLTAYEKTWSNGCLDLAREGEYCTMALVAGWEVTVEVEGETQVYRTNSTGSQIRRAR